MASDSRFTAAARPARAFFLAPALLFAAAGLLPASLASCASLSGGAGNLDVHGMVYDFENRPVPDYELRLDGKRSVFTDATGRFAMYSVPPGDYLLSGSRQGFESYEAPVRIGELTDMYYLRVASAEELLELADGELEEGRIEGAAELVARSERTGSDSSLVPFYAAVVSFRQGKGGEALAILAALEDRGLRDPYVLRMRRDMETLLREAPRDAP